MWQTFLVRIHQWLKTHANHSAWCQTDISSCSVSVIHIINSTYLRKCHHLSHLCLQGFFISSVDHPSMSLTPMPGRWHTPWRVTAGFSADCHRRYTNTGKCVPHFSLNLLHVTMTNYSCMLCGSGRRVQESFSWAFPGPCTSLESCCTEVKTSHLSSDRVCLRASPIV